MAILDLIVGSSTYSLDDGTYCYYQGDDGFGMAQVYDLAERGPQQHGDSDRGFYLAPRNGRLFLQIEGTSWEDMFTRRHALMDIFRPQYRNLSLRWTFDTYTRQLDCHFSGDMQMPSNDRRAFAQDVVVGLKANDPTFYDPDAEVVIFQLGAGSDTWEVPFEVPWTVGASTIDVSSAISYLGSAPSYPVIRITGPLDDAVITNTTLGLKIDLTGINIAAADWYEIDLRYGRKTVKDKAGTNKIADLTTDSDLTNFRIVPDPDASGGTNSITVTGTSATTASKVDITYYTRYIGI